MVKKEAVNKCEKFAIKSEIRKGLKKKKIVEIMFVKRTKEMRCPMKNA